MREYVVAPIVLFALFAVVGCGTKPNAANTGLSPEEAYIDNLMVSGDELKVAEIERARAVQSVKRGQSEGSTSFATEIAGVVANGVRACAGIRYGEGDADILIVRYVFARFPALPLAENDPLPGDDKDKWSRGDDGVASATGFVHVAESVVLAPDDAADEGNEKKKVESRDAPAERVADALRRVTLIANGLVVQIDGTLGKDEFDKAVSAIRGRLATSLKLETRLSKVLDEQRRKREKSVELEQQSDPGSAVYWDLLAKAMGELYTKKY